MLFGALALEDVLGSNLVAALALGASPALLCAVLGIGRLRDAIDDRLRMTVVAATTVLVAGVIARGPARFATGQQYVAEGTVSFGNEGGQLFPSWSALDMMLFLLFIK